MKPSPYPHLGEPPPLGFVQRYSAAKRAAELGFRPIIGRTEGAQFRPAVKYAHGLPSDHPKFAARMLQAHPQCDRLGLVMGECRAGNIFALDVDRNHGNGVDGYAELRAWLDVYGVDRLPRGPRWVTPRGGLQMLFRAPEGMTVRNMSGKHALSPGVDVRGHNGLATIPPTVRADGEYRWCGESSLFDICVPFAPAELLEAVRQRAPEPLPSAPARMERLRVNDDAEQARRRRYVERALDGVIADVAHCGEGGRNAALFQAAMTILAFKQGEGALVHEIDAFCRLRDAAAACGLVAEDGLRCVNATIASAHAAFARQGRPPREVPPPKNETARNPQGSRAA